MGSSGSFLTRQQCVVEISGLGASQLLVLTLFFVIVGVFPDHKLKLSMPVGTVPLSLSRGRGLVPGSGLAG